MRLVIKTGSSTLSKPDGGLDRACVKRLADQLTALHRDGHEIILVTSGAIAAGVGRLGLKSRPTDLSMKQSAAAIGQLALMKAYEESFSTASITPAQILLTREDLMNAARYANVKNTILKLLSLKAIPIINENDSVSTEEIQFGDNDRLAAIVAVKVEADKLILLSDVQGFYETGDDGQLTKTVVPVIEKITKSMEERVSSASGSKMSVGGMAAKLMAAKMATQAGIETWISSGHDADALSKILKKTDGAGTRFIPKAVHATK